MIDRDIELDIDMILMICKYIIKKELVHTTMEVDKS